MTMNSDSIIPENGSIDEDEESSESDNPEDEAGEELHRSESDATGNVVQFLPVHAAPYSPRAASGGKGGGEALKVHRRAGRPRKVERMPTTSDLQYHALVEEQKAKFIDADPVVQASVKHVDPMTMLALIKSEVAKESAALHHQRIENGKYGRDTAQVSSRRIDALKKIADIELELKKLGGDVVDVKSEKMQRIFKFFVDTIRRIAEENLSPEEIDIFFNRLSTEFDGWEEKLAEALR